MRRVLAAVLLCMLASDAGAWPAPVADGLVRHARRLLPVSLGLLMQEHEREIRDEAQRLPADLVRALAADTAAGRIQPATIVAIEGRAAEALSLLRQQRLTEGVVRLGALYAIPAVFTDPALAPEATATPGVSREYYAFLSANLDKIPVVLQDPGALKLDRRQLAVYWQGLLDRSHDHAPVIASELFQGGRVLDHRSFDYRSPLFAVASLSYSRAVTGIAATWLALWREARGDLTRMPSARELHPRSDP
jgi:ribosome modulation factor